MDTTSSFVAVVLLLTANGFFVAAEFALVKARPFRIRGAADAGSAGAKLTLRIQGNLEAYLAACQLGITMASLGLGWVGEPAVAALLEPLFHSMGIPDSVLHTTAFVVGFLIFSSLHIVVGEQVPKTFAIRQAEPVAIWSAYPLHIAYLLVWPLNTLLNRASRSVLSLFGVEEATHADVLTGDELRGLVVTSEEHGEIHHQKADMLRNLFDFDQRQVSRVMIPRTNIKVLDVNAEPEANLAIIRDSRHSRFPVIDSLEGESIVGVVLVKDLQHAVLSGQPEPWKNIREVARQALVVPESQLGWYLEGAYDLGPALGMPAKMSLEPWVRWERLELQRTVPEGLSRDESLNADLLTFGLEWKPDPSVAARRASGGPSCWSDCAQRAGAAQPQGRFSSPGQARVISG